MTEAAALVIRRRRAAGEPEGLAPGSTPGTWTLHGKAGAGRVLQSISEIGLRFRTVIQAVVEPEPTPADLDALDAGRLFITVILGSHLVNTPDEAVRRAWLRAARRHLLGDCDVLIEHHPVDWAETADDAPATDGSGVGMVEVRRDPPFVSAVSVQMVGGGVVRQPFTARVLSERELEEELRTAGLFVRHRLGPTWLQAGPIEPRQLSVPQPPHP